MSADAITRARMLAWALEEWLIMQLQMGRDASQTHRDIRTTKRVIRTLVEGRDQVGAPKVDQTEADASWGAWEFHSRYDLPNHPVAPLPGGDNSIGDSTATRFLRDQRGVGYQLVDFTVRELQTPDAQAQGAAGLANAPTLQYLRTLVGGPPL